ncbi:MAG: PSD1 domain-containing protein [Verrucomicrobia bacterium]|nr:PSD1 domain-containing protein [Verrucomicrobiota bacterium]
MKPSFLVLGAFAASFATSAAAAPSKLDPEQLQFFEKKIRPVLVEHCYKCHSAQAEKLKGGLYVDSRDGLFKGGTSGPAIVPGRPEKSLLVKDMKSTNPDDMMPPKGERLSAQVIADFETWIRMGAPDPRTEASGAAAALKVDWNKAQQHWAYQPVNAPVVPKVKDSGRWAKNDLDKFVLAKLESKGMKPSPSADKRTLIRRAAFDLTGLPPTPQEVADFLADKSANAFEKVVDRLLATPAYGEHWGRHWLDVARYADTSGDRNNNPKNRTSYPFAWTYRDYVIQAFNDDKPYDQFIREQIAGDRIATAENKSPLAAMGFLTVGKRFMGNVNEVIDDRIDVITQGLMGVTASCARCHDHKFDPVSQKDYYSLHGVFSSSTEPSDEPMLSRPKSDSDFQDFLKKSEEILARVAGVRGREEERVLDGFRNAVDKYLVGVRDVHVLGKKPEQVRSGRGLDPDIFEQWRDYLKPAAKEADPVFGPWIAFAALKDDEFAARAAEMSAKFAAAKSVNELVAKLFATPPESLKALAESYGNLFRETEKLADKGDQPKGARVELHAVLHGKETPIQISDRGLRRIVGAGLNAREATERAKLDELKRTHPGSPPRAMAMTDSDKPRDSFVMIRGEASNRGPVVKRRWLEILGGSDAKPFTTGSGRLDLANEVVSKANPLTARVFVNRVWNWHFGDAIVRTLGDFGLRSDPPSNQPLLDYAASRLMAEGWSVKKLHKLILLSATWQQTTHDTPANSKVDPGNALFWRQNLQRLNFESLRDTLLLLGGKHEFEDRGGPSEDDINASGRRTLYGYIDRTKISDSLRIFDFANPDMTAPSRVLTTVPLQALYLMNNGFVVEQARHVAARPELLSGTKDEEKIAFIYQLFFQRAPSSAELKLGLEYVADQQAKPALGGNDVRAWHYGYGEYDRVAKKLVAFDPFPTFLRDSWVLADKSVVRKAAEVKKDNPKIKVTLAAGTAFTVSLNAVGGVPGDGKHSVVRRWVAPRDGTLSIEGKLEHDAKTGDGVEAFVALSGGGQMGTWQASGNDVATNLKNIQVRRGDSIDFIVTSRGNIEGDSFRWAPILHMPGMKPGQESLWNSQQEFSGPVKQKLEAQQFTPWERLSQALLMSNELIYVN